MASERFRFSVAYDEAELKGAVQGYLVRALFLEHSWISVMAFLGLTIGASLLIFARELTFVTGVMAGVWVAIVAMFAFIALAHWRGMKAKLKRMKSPRSEFVFSEDGFEVSADSGSVRYNWETIRQIWKLKRVWLLMFASNQFITLPLAGVSADALGYLESRIQPRRL